MTITNVTIEIQNEKEHILKCLGAIYQYCKKHYTPWLAAQDIRVMLTANDGSHPMFAVCGDGDVWFMPHDRAYTLLTSGGSRNQSIYAHWEEGIALVSAWPMIKSTIDGALAQRLKREQSFMGVQA